MTNNDVIIINYEMIPYALSWGACQRSYYLAEHLTDSGFNTAVVACKLSQVHNDYGKNPNFNIIFTNQNNGNHQNTPKSSLPPFVIQHLKKLSKPLIHNIERFYFNEINPGCGVRAFLWINKAFSKLSKLIKPNRQTAIIISCPPFALLSIINKLKRNHSQVRIIIDYRDPWNLWNNARGLSFSREKKYINLADKIIITTEALREAFINDYKVSGHKIAVIGNGYSEKQWSEIGCVKKENNKIAVSYVGSIVFMNGTYRDTSEFFKAYDMLDEKGLYEIRFIGVADTPQLQSLMRKYPEITFKAKVSPRESYEYMQESDVLFNLHTANNQSSKYLIGGKIYDYLRSGKLIWYINTKDSFEQGFLIKNSNAICCENDYREILSAFNKIKTAMSKEKTVDSKTIAIKQYSREHQNNKYCELLKEIQ